MIRLLLVFVGIAPLFTFGQYANLTCNQHPHEFYDVECGSIIDLAGDINEALEDCPNAWFEYTNISEIEIVNDGGQQEGVNDPVQNELHSVVPMESVVSSYFNAGSVINVDEMLNYMHETPYYEQNVLNLNWGRYFDVVVVYRIDYQDYTGAGTGEPLWNDQDAIVRIRYRIRHASNIKKQNSLTSLCSGRKYALADLFEPLPNYFTNYSISSSASFSYNPTLDSIEFDVALPQTVELQINAEDLLGFNICKKWYLPFGNTEEAWFTDVVQSSGIITSSSSPVNMHNYVDYTGGDIEYAGTGLVQNGPVTYFDPSFASPGDNIMYVRSNNNGCISDWHDTVFFVTPTVVTFDAPVWDVGYTFNGDYGADLTKNVTGNVEEVGKYHMACSNQSYSFVPTNHLLGLDLEYKVLWHGQIIETGIVSPGQTIDITTPDSIDYNVTSSVSTAEDLFFPGSSQLTYNLLYNTNAGDLNNNGTLDNDDYVAGVALGDELRIVGRYVNVLNQVSDFTAFVIGVVKTPSTAVNDLLCFDGNPVLNGVSSTPVYHDSVDIYKYRSGIWDVEMDGVYDVDGSNDNYLYQLPNVVKEYTMLNQIIDSTYLWMYSPYLNEYVDVFKENVSTVCYSTVDTISVIRNPSPEVSFNVVGIQTIGSYVASSVDGVWFVPNQDSIAWQWSDNSPLYSGSENWHYLNDLGNYSLDLRVEDSYGCVVDSSFYNYWFVPGVLNITEDKLEDLEIYPVPVKTILYIKGSLEGDLFTVYSVSGKVMFRGKGAEINMTEYENGVYILKIERDNIIIDKKIVKI